MITEEQIKALKPGDCIWYKNIHIYPEKLTISEIKQFNDDLEIYLEDGTYIKQGDTNIFLTQEECTDSCEKELNERLDKLRLMLKTSKGE